MLCLCVCTHFLIKLEPLFGPGPTDSVITSLAGTVDEVHLIVEVEYHISSRDRVLLFVKVVNNQVVKSSIVL
jgi:hypothetical protein